MPPHGPSRREIRKLTGESDPDDGVDPKRPKRSRAARRPLPGSPARKTLQLCGQVARVLNEVLAADPNELLQSVLVERVDPAPDAGRLLATAVPVGPLPEGIGPAQLAARLNAAATTLRAEIAAVITRRRAPTIAFQVRFPEPTGTTDPGP